VGVVVLKRTEPVYVGGSDHDRGWAMQMVAQHGWIDEILPDDSARHPDSAAGVAMLNNVVTKRRVWVNNSGSYGNRIFVVRGVARQKVIARDSAAANAEMKAIMEEDGFPIPDPFVLDVDTGTYPDLTAGIFDLDTDTYFEGHVLLPPGHPSGHPDYWSASWGGRMSGASFRASGHWIDLATGAWGKHSKNERTYHGASGSHLPMSRLSITRRDWANRKIDHVTGFMMPGYEVPGQPYEIEPPVWPAQGADYSSRPEMPMGGRYRLPRSFMTPEEVEAIEDEAVRMFVRAFIEHGIIHYDSDSRFVKNDEGGNPIPGEPDQPLIWRTEEAVLAGVNLTSLFNALIDMGAFSQLERIATGSDDEFTPRRIPPPMPIYSRGLPSSHTALNNGTYHDNAAIGLDRAWIDLRTVPADQKRHTLIWWTSFKKPTLTDGGPRDGVPRDFSIQTNGSTGSTPTGAWTDVPGLSFSGNTTAGAIYADVDLSEANYVGINVTAQNVNGVSLQMDLHNAALGARDTIAIWGDSNPQQIFLGGPISGGAYNGGSLESLLEALTGRPAPAILNMGFGGATTGSLLSGVGSPSIAPILALPVRYVVVGGGTNDAANAGTAMSTAQVDQVAANWQSMITQIEAAGKVAILPTVPWGNANATHAANVAAMNARIPALLAANPDVIPGPDLYALSNGQHNLIYDGRHLTFDTASQPTTLSHPLGLPDGLSGAEAALRLLRDVLATYVYEVM
jgi:hypothetical protein